jgi:hypothetical protein
MGAIDDRRAVFARWPHAGHRLREISSNHNFSPLTICYKPHRNHTAFQRVNKPQTAKASQAGLALSASNVVERMISLLLRIPWNPPRHFKEN